MKKGNNSNGVKVMMGKAAEEWQEVLWDNVIKGLSKSKSEKELRGILESLLTEDEKKMILRRLATTVLIKQGKSYRQIGEILWISPATISAIKINLLSKSSYHKSHRLVYGNKSQPKANADPPEKLLSDRVADFIVELAENAAREFSRSGLTLGSYTRSTRRFQNKN